MRQHKVYWRIIKRNGWHELHVSMDEEAVLLNEALSKKIPIISKFAAKALKDWRREMKLMGSHMTEVTWGGPFYILAEDLAAAVIGPFQTKKAAEEHIDFCKKRGDGATMRIVDGKKAADNWASTELALRLTPEEDRNFEMPKVKEL